MEKNKAAILPILNEKSNKYKGMKYLGIYPYIDYVQDKNGKFDFGVNDSQIKNKYTTLKKMVKWRKVNRTLNKNKL